MKIRALNTIKHDGIYRYPGTEFDVSDELGASLCGLEAAEPVEILEQPGAFTASTSPSQPSVAPAPLRKGKGKK